MNNSLHANAGLVMVLVVLVHCIWLFFVVLLRLFFAKTVQNCCGDACGNFRHDLLAKHAPQTRCPQVRPPRIRPLRGHSSSQGLACQLKRTLVRALAKSMSFAPRWLLLP